MQFILSARSFAISLVAISLFWTSPVFGYIETINDGAVSAPEVAFKQINGIGWYYSPQFSYYLTGVYSTFGSLFSGPTQTLTVEFQSDRPTNGGGVLRQGTFTASNAGGNLGASFPPLLLQAGQTYFVDYENTNNIGINLGTWENDGNGNPHPSGGATTNLGTWYVDNANGFASVQTQQYGFAENNAHVSGSEPILRFDGFLVPEPSSAMLLATSVCGLWLRRRSRGTVFPVAAA